MGESTNFPGFWFWDSFGQVLSCPVETRAAKAVGLRTVSPVYSFRWCRRGAGRAAHLAGSQGRRAADGQPGEFLQVPPPLPTEQFTRPLSNVVAKLLSEKRAKVT